MNTTTGSNSSFPTIKTVNGKKVGDDCVCCDKHLERGRWLCSKCSRAIGYTNINNVVYSMPEYLADNQYEKWLKLKLLQFINDNKD